MKLSLKTVLILCFTTIIIFSISAIILSSYYSTKGIMTAQSYKIMQNISDFAIDKSKSYMKIARDAAKLTQQLESNYVVNTSNSDEMYKYFYEQMILNQHFSGIYYGKTSGEFMMLLKNKKGFLIKDISHNKKNQRIVKKTQYSRLMEELSSSIDIKDGYDPRKRPWYKAAVTNKKLSWTEPYVFFTSKKPGITTSAPIYNADGSLRGVVGVDIEIDELAKFISQLKISDNGRVFIMDKSLKMISLPIVESGKKYRLQTIDELDDNSMVKHSYYELIEKNNLNNITKETFISFSKEGKNYQAMFYPFEVNDIKWVIGMYAYEDDYLGLLKRNEQLNILIMILIGLISIYISIKMSQVISKPIARLGDMAHELKELNLNIPSIEPSHILEINEAIESFNTMKSNLKGSYTDTLYRLAIASEYKDNDTAEHIVRIGLCSEVIGKNLGLTEHEIYILKHASTMHDIGKLGISDEILLKPGRLTIHEREIMKRHSEIGASILENPTSDIMAAAQEIALLHHERWDGKGYPKGLEREQIPIFARIVAVVDVFDALISKRCYKEPFDVNESKKIIIEGSGRHFDPKVVDAFVRSFDDIINISKKNS